MNIFKNHLTRRLKNRKTLVPKKENRPPRLPYEKRESLSPLLLFFTVVNRDQSRYFVDAYAEAGASLSLVQYGYSNPPEEIAALLGADSLKKDIVVTVCRKEDVNKLEQIARERFKVSQLAKGVAFACPIDAVSGIAVYRYLADSERGEREENHGAQ